jgi:hypothetical protein
VRLGGGNGRIKVNKPSYLSLLFLSFSDSFYCGHASFYLFLCILIAMLKNMFFYKCLWCGLMNLLWLSLISPDFQPLALLQPANYIYYNGKNN